MAISVTCGTCGKSFSVGDEWAGREGKCPACGARLAVPATGQPEAMAPPPPPPQYLEPPPIMPRQQGMPAWAIVLIVLGAVFVFFVLVAAGMMLPALARAREEARRIRCRSNLHQIARGMAVYLNEEGDNRFFPWPAGRPGCGSVETPDFGGAEWLASLYWTRIIPDPGVYLCPSSGDDNAAGAALGDVGAPGGRRLPPAAVSYAAFGDKSVGIYLATKESKPSFAGRSLAIPDDFPPWEPMASDDTQPPINHGTRDNGGMCVLLFDSHVEYWTHTRVDLERGVGRGELCALMN